MLRLRGFVAAAALMGAAACDVNVNADNNSDATAGTEQSQRNEQATAPGANAQTGLNPQSIARARELANSTVPEARRAEMRQQARTEMGELRFVVDISDRKLRVYRGDEQVRTHDVAVGTDENPTPTGEFQFNRVDLNPEWIPPDSEWAEDRERQPPGSPDNPMGRARLVYKMPYTIHGTDNLDSLGKAVSHGSIRVANENVVELAEMLLKAGGSWHGEEWFRQMTQNRDEEYQIELENPIPLKNQE